MTWSDFGGSGGDGLAGPPQALVAVDVEKLESLALAARDGGCAGFNGPDAGAGGCGVLLAPLYSSATFSGGGAAGALVGLDWIDPSGCRPAFCVSVCPKGAQCIGARCSPSINDGLGVAQTLHWVTYANAPDGTDFDLRVIAVSAPGCPSDVSAAIDQGLAGLAFSAPILIEMQITNQAVTTSTGTGGTSGGSSGGTSSDACPSQSAGCLQASTLTCTPLGQTGEASACIPASEFQQAGVAMPCLCAPENTTGCLNSTGTLVKPCCGNLTCRVASACGGGSVGGGVCLP